MGAVGTCSGDDGDTKRDEPDQFIVQILCVNICIRNTISVSLYISKEKAKFDLFFFYFFFMIITFWPAETYLELHPLYKRFCATQIKL